jgi:hypothetical protein
MITIACCAPEGVEPKFKTGEIVLVEGHKYTVDYSYYGDNSFVYLLDPLDNGKSRLKINENSISKYVKNESQPEVDSTYIIESDTIAY